MLLLIIFCFIVPIHSYLYWRLGTSPWDAIWLLAPLLLIATFPFKRIHRIQRELIYLSLGVVTYIVLSTLARDIWFLGTGQLLDRSWVIIATGLLVAAGSLHAYLGPHVKHVKLKVSGLHPDLVGFKIIQLSDLHIGPTIRLPYIKRVVRKTNELSPDLIVMTGDIGDGPMHAYQKDAEGLGELRAEHGVAYVSGNHEHYWGVSDWMKTMEQMGFHVLKNSNYVFRQQGATVSVNGVPDPVSKIKMQLEELAQTPADFKIILSHRPGIAHKTSELGYHLQLSGHTHGGQFFPWTIVVRFVHEFNKGLARVGEMWVYVNVGTGSWGPRLRLGSTSEITLLELVRADEH